MLGKVCQRRITSSGALSLKFSTQWRNESILRPLLLNNFPHYTKSRKLKQSSLEYLFAAEEEQKYRAGDQAEIIKKEKNEERNPGQFQAHHIADNCPGATDGVKVGDGVGVEWIQSGKKLVI